ncbi:homoprotocatechuate degradation operon regulator HpaR [Aliihoeflea aestuarii]|jgi:homoprotocatechuate degradation regulator HpaR|uniref:homoprotocatechuate degradation operon regulator HpaR n=1 Tax=Aliihoeflea aestuarii TaxID=453840 RepID=UPI00209319C1|nr:homoprotocatechuate degradation operon regulator HpaR [Aliihoeflea aestuarii]MCO6390734.1 homoprotocatechuate degradation operon regulator HpaR [Aliihoeflea aestuarii]
MSAAGDHVDEDTFLPGDTSRSLPISLLRAREAVMVRFRPLLASHDLTEQQWRVIRMLGETSPLDASDLAERACILAPSLTRIIKSLEERGLIRRERDDGDARRALLSLNPAGRDLIRTVMPQSNAIYMRLQARYGHDKVEILIDMLNELAATRDGK